MNKGKVPFVLFPHLYMGKQLHVSVFCISVRAEQPVNSKQCFIVSFLN